MKLTLLLLLMIATTLSAGRKTDKFFKKTNKLISKIHKSQKVLLYEELQEVVLQGGDYLGYSKFATSYLNQWHKIKSNQKYRYRYRRNRRNSISAIDLFSGGIAIRESLQIDTINKTGNVSVINKKNKILLSSLKGPEIKSHPFKEMLGTKKYKLSKLSKIAPNDFYYIHITSFTKALNLWDDLMLKIKPLYKRFETANVDYKIKDKIMLQIGLKENKALRIFYDLVVEEAAIVGSDPFIITGSDISIIFNIKNSLLFENTITKYRKEIKKEEKAKIKNIKISGYLVNYMFTKNRKVNSYYLKLDKKHFVLSNSKEAIKEIINTYKNEKKSLFATDEYKYMRSIYKLDKDEGIFLYLSDPFIRRLVGAEIRLKEAQRITTQFRLAKMQNLLMLYHDLYKKAPKSLQEMIIKLAPKDNKKEHYNYFMNLAKYLKLSKDKTIKSVIYGYSGYFRPNIDNTRFKFVSQEEANRYNEFLKNYNNYWKDYFDPIGIKISTQNEKVIIDTHILPLINSSMYNEVKRAIGGKGVKLNHQKLGSEWLKISFKVSDNVKALLPRAYKELKRELKIKNKEYIDFSKMIGDHITFSVMDSSPLVDFNMNGLFTDMVTRRSGGMGIVVLMVSSLAHPIRASLALKKDIALLKKELESVITHLTKYDIDNDFSWTFYKKSYKAQDYTVATIKFWEMITFRVYFMFTKNSLELTSTERYLKTIIDSISPSNPLKGKISKSTHPLGGGGANRNISISFHPNAIKLEKEYFTNMLIDNLIKNNLRNIRTLSLVRSIYGKKLNKKEFYNKFGFNISSPLNEEYIYNDRTISHPSLSGYKLEKINIEKLQKEILNKYYNIKNASIEFEFTDTGIDTRIIINP